MFGRFLSLLVLAWLAGFLWFSIALPTPMVGGKSDAVVVFTGGGGRIERGLEALREDWAPRMLVSGVDREVKPEEFRAEYGIPDSLMACCIDLGFKSYDTRSNAVEAAEWLEERKATSARLITTDWHMRRAALDLERALPENFEMKEDAVSSEPSLRILFLEYHKFLARFVSRLWER